MTMCAWSNKTIDTSVGRQVRIIARQIPATISEDGNYRLECSAGSAAILGWVVQTDDDTHAEKTVPPDPRLFTVLARRAAPKTNSKREWLDIERPAEAAYLKKMGDHVLAQDESLRNLYYCISETAQAELKRATNELHALFMHATDYVLSDESQLEKFNLPRALWEKIQQSWSNRRNQMITGRFDFTLSERGLKLYEYNCDSASCHLETGRLQGSWARKRWLRRRRGCRRDARRSSERRVAAQRRQRYRAHHARS